ncbi:copper amine oxidase protein, partial [Lasius niger]
MFSYSFFMDGSIAVEVRASGYIRAGHSAHDEDSGFRVHDFVSGSIHDHVMNFKVDFDILGTPNTVQLLRKVPVSRSYPWSGGKARNTMKLTRSFVDSEDRSRFNWGPNGDTQVLVVNQDEKNSYGEFRGYRIQPYAGLLHLTVQDSSN